MKKTLIKRRIPWQVRDSETEIIRGMIADRAQESELANEVDYIIEQGQQIYARRLLAVRIFQECVKGRSWQ